jgi:hypothetical protein
MKDSLAYFRQTLAGFLQLLQKFQLLIFAFIIIPSLFLLYQQVIFIKNNLLADIKYIIEQNNNTQQKYLHEINTSLSLLFNSQVNNNSEIKTGSIENFKKYEQLKLLYQALNVEVKI